VPVPADVLRVRDRRRQATRLVVGSALAVARIARCNPLFEGGYDPGPSIVVSASRAREGELNMEGQGKRLLLAVALRAGHDVPVLEAGFFGGDKTLRPRRRPRRPR